MLLRIVLLLIMVPLLETTVLLLLADRLGFAMTFGLVIASGVLGAGLLRRQGLRAIARLREQVHDGRLPTTELLDGVMILVAGVLLLTPGVLTDVCGLMLLIPYSRAWMRRAAIGWFKSRWHLRGFTGVSSRASGRAEQGSQVIDSYVVRAGGEHIDPV